MIRYYRVSSDVSRKRAAAAEADCAMTLRPAAAAGKHSMHTDLVEDLLEAPVPQVPDTHCSEAAVRVFL